jgi:hypothetical protein
MGDYLMNKEYIRLEPSKQYDKAIVKRSKDGCLTYNYDLLVLVTIRVHSFDYETAQEWVDYNIVSLAPHGFKVSYAQAK